MRVTCCVLIYVIEIFYQQCFGLHVIDLPRFGSNKELEADSMKNKENKYSSSFNQDTIAYSNENESTAPSDDFNFRRHMQVQSKMRRKSLYLRPYSPKEPRFNSTSSPDTTTTTISKSTTSRKTSSQDKSLSKSWPPVRTSTHSYRRHWLLRNPAPETLEDKDENIKSKITMLVDQTMHDAEDSMQIVKELKEKHKSKPSYRIGFLLSMIKKSRDVLNELFNVAVKHRAEWKTLEQLKVFELIVHTNVDTNNLVRQLVDIHVHSQPTSKATTESSSSPPSQQPTVPQQDQPEQTPQPQLPPGFRSLKGSWNQLRML